MCKPPILGMLDSVLMPVWTHGTLIHPPPPAAADSDFWLASGKNRFFLTKNSIFVKFLPYGVHFIYTPPILRVPDALATLVCHQMRSCDLQQGAGWCCLSNFSTAHFSKGLKVLFLGKLTRTDVQHPQPP